MERREAPPRKYFFSPVGTPVPVKVKFIDEPVWKPSPNGKGERLCGRVCVNDSVFPIELEQFTPDAYLLCDALIKALGGTVQGITARVGITTKKVMTRRGSEVAVIENFVVERVTNA